MDYLKELDKELSKNRAVKIYKKILKGKERSFPYGFWSKNNRKYEDANACIRYLVEVVLKWDHNDMKKMTKAKIRTYKLGGMLKAVYNDDLYKAIDSVYEYLFYPWHLNRCNKGFWDKERAIIAIRSGVAENGWSREDIIKNYNKDFFREKGLSYMLKVVFNGDIYESLMAAYPGEYKIWELRRVPAGYWSEENIKIAVRWMIEDILGWSKNDVVQKLNKDVFANHGLSGMLYTKCGNSPYKALEIAYPGEYKIWELGSVSKGYWSKETANEAIKHMIEEDLGYSKEDIKNKLSRKDFKKYGYVYVLDSIYNGDIYEVVNSIYPNEFKRVQIKRAKVEKEMNMLMKKILWYD